MVFEPTGKQLSYGELKAQVLGLAGYLGALGVGPDVLVPLMVERSVEMVVGIYGVMSAGGGYVPLDSGLPVERLRCMLDDVAISECTVALT